MDVAAAKVVGKVAKMQPVVWGKLWDAHVQGIREELAVRQIAGADGSNLQTGCLCAMTRRARLIGQDMALLGKFCVAVWRGALRMQGSEMFCADPHVADLVLTPPVPTAKPGGVLFHALRTQPARVSRKEAVCPVAAPRRQTRLGDIGYIPAIGHAEVDRSNSVAQKEIL